MGLPVLLIHGYSSEGSRSDAQSVSEIYGSLADDLRQSANLKVEEIYLSRWLSLEDGVTLDDVSLALDRALRISRPHLLAGQFNVIIHSTGALVVRNWIRRFSPKPSPINNLIHLAGAHFGSGLAHIGRGQIARWGRYIFHGGEEAGIRILRELELGASSTIDLHRFFQEPSHRMFEDYQIQEYCIIGTQARPNVFEVPIRYCKEDGSDGVVRVSGGNLNWNYFQISPTAMAHGLTWAKMGYYLGLFERKKYDSSELYYVSESWQPETGSRALVPVAIPYNCCHGGSETGVVAGRKTRGTVFPLIQQALDVPKNNFVEYQKLVGVFDEVTRDSHERVKTDQDELFSMFQVNPKEQYDPHAQVIFRVRDQFGNPVEKYDVNFDAPCVPGDESGLPIRKLFEDKHVNNHTKGIICFYLRLAKFDQPSNNWLSQIARVRNCSFEISAVEDQTLEIGYLPVRYSFDSQALMQVIHAHRTTVVDVTLLRIPSGEIFKIV